MNLWKECILATNDYQVYHLYNLAVSIAAFFLKIVALFNPKIQLFVQGRKSTWTTLTQNISAEDRVLWIHTASLGEYEQGLPIIEQLKEVYPSHTLLLSFFSPSGYEVKKKNTIADCTIYLPLDTRKNVSKFLKIAHPELAIFVKYEVWPGYLRQLDRAGTPTLLVSALFKKNHVFFRWYGGFMRNALKAFTHFFVQDKDSETRLHGIGFRNVTISGDTRFDRVSKILERDNSLDFMMQFKQEYPCFIAGSTWPEDEAILIPHINSDNSSTKYVLAPHNIKTEQINILKKSFSKNVMLYSEITSETLKDTEVLIIDTIGLLTKIYSYADIAYVGGGFGNKGLHNTLEPAVFGIPVIIGPHYNGFKEAEDLVSQKGIIVVTSTKAFEQQMTHFLSDAVYLKKTGDINSTYINASIGATSQIMDHIKTCIVPL